MHSDYERYKGMRTLLPVVWEFARVKAPESCSDSWEKDAYKTLPHMDPALSGSCSTRSPET